MTDDHPRERIERWIDLPADPAAIWAVIGPFGALADWHPMVRACEVVEIDGEVHRHVTLSDDELLLERLDREEAHSLHYSLVDGPLPVQDYRATLTCFAQAPGARVFWSATFETHDPAVADLIAGILEAGLDALRERFGG